jgi:SpoIIAA-like
MIEPLSNLPAGVIGFKTVGKIEASDYTEVFVPAVENAAAAGGVRLVFVFEKFEGMSGGAAWQDMKLGFEHLKAWKRTALVTDIDWMTHATAMFGWLTPGEVRCFPLAELDAAIAWAAAT